MKQYENTVNSGRAISVNMRLTSTNDMETREREEQRTRKAREVWKLRLGAEISAFDAFSM